MSWLTLEDPARPGSFCRLAYVRSDAPSAGGTWLSYAGVAYWLSDAEAAALVGGRAGGRGEGPVRHARPSATAPTPAPPRATKPGEVVAPAAGRICAVRVQQGQKLAPGEAVATLEAMKVELPVAAAQGGTVACVHCAEGDWVEAGQPLVTLTAGSAVGSDPEGV